MSLKLKINTTQNIKAKTVGLPEEKEIENSFIDIECTGHTIVRYGALTAPLKEVLELGFAWAYGSNLPNSQNDEFRRLCEEVLSVNREIERNDHLERKT